MDFLADGLRRALALLFSGDAEVYGVAFLTMKVALIATVIACAAGIPAGFALAAVLTAAFGQTVAEVGAAMMVGGNIRGSTRTLTTAVTLYTSQGEFGLALALGIILVTLALLVNVGLQLLQGRGGGGAEGGGAHA